MLPNEPIETYQLEQNSTSSHTTTFYDAHVITNDATLRPTDAERPSPCNISDITNFLKIPRPIYDGLWGTATAGHSLINQLSLPYSLLSQARVAAKMDHFKYLRADIRISIRINSSAMHQGRLLISYSPRFNHRSAIPKCETTITHHSSLQHIQLDLGRANNATMLIPYALPYEFMDLDDFALTTSTTYEMGAIFIWVLNQLRSDSGTPVNYKIYANFENITLSGSCGPKERVFADPRLAVPVLDDPTTTVVKYIYEHETENGIVTQMKPSKEAEKKSETGVVSGFMETTAKFLKPFSVLPVVGEFASLFSDGAMAIGGAAKAIGWSNPPDLRASLPVISTFYNTTNTSGLSTAYTLTHDTADLVQPVGHLLSSVPNEMEISRIIATPFLIDTFQIKSTDTEGANLWNHILSPINVRYAPVPKLVFHSPLSFIASAFTHWRGSMRFHLSFVTNAFSAARVRVMWVPPGFSVPTTNADAAEYMSAVIDVVGPTEYSFIVPFCASTPWLSIPVTSHNHSVGTYGSLAIHLENALVSNVAVPLPIECNVWISAAPDMQFSRFTDARMNIKFQADTSITACLDLDTIRKANYVPLAEGIFYTEHNVCTPDTITSIKQLCSRMTNYASGGLVNTNEIFVSPYSPSSAKRQTPINWFAHMYRYGRGTFKFSVNNYDATGYGYINMLNATLPYTPDTSWKVLTASDVTNKISATHVNGGLLFASKMTTQSVVSVPFYSTMYAITLSRSDAIVRDQPVCGLMMNGTIGNSVYMMGTGDDWEFLSLLGAPTLETDLNAYSYTLLLN
ncbi:hypothetical protein 2 [Changjiang crawfish virus 5]|uniref:hypothetical protein 2 n=1 Tax=Changjiang crawfish virus 5 TaxID=1922769 RepID=UPI00090A49A2|nr:hypothetical protein 2 [Changjiang crawfish virus 5]APG78987.1 hypothetical protein 2 [Changjiang crawfish virus 5]